MLKSLAREITLTVQARTGATPALLLWFAIITLASLTAFAFLCVAGYAWLAIEFGSVFAALIMTGIFLLIAAIAAVICALARRRARERAILERAARAHASSWLLDPKLLATAVQLGRTIGWQRLVPVALLGFMAAQWAREYRERDTNIAD
jgi:type VI protein secretion system component VasK